MFDKYIINSLMDIDFYKFTMGQLIFLKYGKVKVKFAFTNRTKGVKLSRIIHREDLVRELDHARSLKFSKSELHYLRGTNEYQDRMFRENYLEHLGRLELPRYGLVFIKNGNIVLEFEGNWEDVLYWETIALSIINELYYRALIKDLTKFEKESVYAQGTLNLLEKVKLLKKYPFITFTDFGTRRRFSFEWQKYVVKTLAEELPGQFLGTSNTYLAMVKSLLPMGTDAHETDMVLAGHFGETDEGLIRSHNQKLRDWWEIYGFGLSVALTDTFGTDFFFRDMDEEQANKWKGLRHDSGDPIEFGEKTIKFYEGYGIEPKEKMIVFSDGLTLPKIIELAEHFKNRIKVTFGWGTNLTNDMGFGPLSLVAKAVEADGRPLVKLSDNLSKAIGPRDEIQRYKRVFGYKVTLKEICVY